MIDRFFSQALFTTLPVTVADPADYSDDELTREQLRDRLNQFHDWLVMAFDADIDIMLLMQARSYFMDRLLLRLWQHYGLSQHRQLTLIAVGGYGRCELQPLSDLDVLILWQPDTSHDTTTQPAEAHMTEALSETVAQPLSYWLNMLWDLKLPISHSVRTLSDCLDKGRQDITIATALFESRYLTGNVTLFDDLQQALFDHSFWPSPLFLRAKKNEQQLRHQRQHDTGNNLEPDIKNSPGGLRDIHILRWIARRHFAVTQLHDLVALQVLTENEEAELHRELRFLCRLRFALHLTLTRQDNRLLFDQQMATAKQAGYQGEGNAPIESMMCDFYRSTHQVRELNQIVLQLFAERITPTEQPAVVLPLENHFHLIGSQIGIKDPSLFHRQPHYMIRMFVIIAFNPNISGITVETLRLLRQARQTLRYHFAHYTQARRDFITLFQQPAAVTRALLPMHHHSILWRYMPNWQNIVGRMQFDLFHAFTVDEHTIRVLLNLESFLYEETAERHPLCVECYQQLPQPELLLIAGLFHDIAKGRGGNHSQQGAKQVEEFAKLHQFSDQESQLVGWLVRHHLLMSITAQRRDIQDPSVVKEFSQKVGSVERLRYLFCLSVADICATNETLWNGWRKSLLTQLYHATLKQLQQQTLPAAEPAPTLRTRLQRNQLQASQQLVSQGVDAEDYQALWQRCHANYFLRHSPQQIAWHSQHIIAHGFSAEDRQRSLVLINPNISHGGTEIFIYCMDKPYLFSAIAQALEYRKLTIQGAQIFTNRDGMAMDTFIVLDNKGNPLTTDRHADIQTALLYVITQEFFVKPPISLFSKHQLFNVNTEVNFLETHASKYTYVEIITLDRPGLLARISEILADLQISLHGAQINTVGERAEDLFVLTTQEKTSLSSSTRQLLAQRLTAALETLK